MLLTDYTTYNEVRAVLGVDLDELSDNTLALEVYLRSLELELQGIAAALPADFATVKVVAEASRTASQQAFYAAVKLFAPYAVAVQLSSGLSLFAPKTVTDGKAVVTRDSSAPYKAAIEECKANYSRFRVVLVNAYAAYKGSASVGTVRPFFVVVSPASDPVTRRK